MAADLREEYIGKLLNGKIRRLFKLKSLLESSMSLFSRENIASSLTFPMTRQSPTYIYQ